MKQKNNLQSNKKQEFTDGGRKKGFNFVFAGIFVVIFLAIAAYVISSNDTAGERVRYTPGEFNIGSSYTYDEVTSMTPVESKIVDDKVVLSLADVKENGLLYTRVPVETSYMPLTSFIAPSGRLVVAFSICEPCSSDTFRIDNQYIICESCGTTWTLEGLQGVAGGCQDHPPEEIFYEVVGDEIQIPVQQVYDWVPRPY